MRIVMTGETGGIGHYIRAELAKQHPDALIEPLAREGEDLMEDPSIWPQADVAILCAAPRLTDVDRRIEPYELMVREMRIVSGSLDRLLTEPPPHVVYLSSATVYESCPTDRGWWTESDQDQRDDGYPDRGVPPHNAVGFAKLAAERLVRAWCTEHKATYTIWRLFNVITPREPHHQHEGGHVQVDLYRRMITQAQPVIEMATDGRERRSWTWVGDIAEVIARFAVATRDVRNEVYNLGSDHHASVRQLARAMLVAARRLGIVSPDYAPAFHWNENRVAPFGWPLTAYAQSRLGFEAKTTLDEMMELFLAGKAAL